MRAKAAILLGGLVVLIDAWLWGGRLPKEVVRHPQPTIALAERLDWAGDETSRQGFRDGYWVCYSIRRLMGGRSWIGSFSSRQRDEEIPIQEVITGERHAFPSLAEEEMLERAAREALSDIERSGEKKSKEPEKTVWKEVGILLRYGAGREKVLEDVHMSNLSLAFDFKGLPLVWIGGASDEESLNLIKTLYGRVNSPKAKEGLLAAAGIHGSPGLVIPFLDAVLKGNESEDLRKDAAFWLGQQHDPRALAILRQAAEKDSSAEVREGAVFAISQLEIEAALDELIGLARKAGHGDVRKQAIFWLGQKASAKTVAALESFAYNDADTKIQEQAVFALSELPDHEGVEALIKIAKTHPNAHVRKKAVFWLGECGDPRALDALIEIVKGK